MIDSYIKQFVRVNDDVIYYPDQKIGQNFQNYSIVYSGTNKKTNERIAVKIIKYNWSNNSFLFQRLSDNKLVTHKTVQLESYNTDNIIKLHSIEVYSEKEIQIVMEYCEQGSLDKYLKNKGGKLPEDEVKVIFEHIANGLFCLEQKNIAHRNLKPTNILQNDNLWKLSDFIFSKETTGDNLKTIAGKPIYIAPQILKGYLPPFENDTYTNKCDVFSLGIIIYELLCGQRPWPLETPNGLYHQMTTNPLTFPNDVGVSQSLKDLLKSMLEISEANRISTTQLVNHIFFQNSLSISESESVLISINKIKFPNSSMTQSTISITSDQFSNYQLEQKSSKQGEYFGIVNKLEVEKNKINYLCLITESVFGGENQQFGIDITNFNEALSFYAFCLFQNLRISILIKQLGELDPTQNMFILQNICTIDEFLKFKMDSQSQKQKQDLTNIKSYLDQQLDYVVNLMSIFTDITQYQTNDYLKQLNPLTIQSENLINKKQIIEKYFFSQRQVICQIMKFNISSNWPIDTLIWCYHFIQSHKSLNEIFLDNTNKLFNFDYHSVYQYPRTLNQQELYNQCLNFLNQQ